MKAWLGQGTKEGELTGLGHLLDTWLGEERQKMIHFESRDLENWGEEN